MNQDYVWSDSQEIPLVELLSLYDSVGWSAYTNQPKRLQAAVEASLKVISLWHQERLCALIRVVGDGLTIIYIQDLLVNPAYQKQGLGSQLLTKILTDYADVRQKVLLTEENPITRKFYESLEFKSCDKGQVVAFAKFN